MPGPIIVLLTIAAAAVLLWQLVALVNGLRSTRWPVTVGRVLSSRAEESGLSVGGHVGPHEDTPRGEAQPLFVLRVRYEYAVGGRTFRSDRVRFGSGGLGSETAVGERQRGVQVGSDVPVYYDPRRPWSAVLQQGADSAHYFWSGVWLVAVLLGVGMYLGCLPGAA